MNRCPACEYLVPPAWDMCKRCGAALQAPVGAGVAVAPVHAYTHTSAAPRTAPPAAPTPTYTDSDLLPGGGRIPRPQPAVPSFDLLPSGGAQHSAPTRSAASRSGSGRGRLFVVVAIVVLGGAAFALWPSGGGGGKGSTAAGDMEILPSNEDMAGVPSIDSAFRVEAEVGARQATMIIMQGYAEMGTASAITPDFLMQYDPSLQFVDGSQVSTGARVVSMRATATHITVAIAGQGDVCAFGRVDGQLTTAYVTAKTSSCSADGAPTQGWTAMAGGGMGGAVDPGYTDPSLDEMLGDPTLVTS